MPWIAAGGAVLGGLLGGSGSSGGGAPRWLKPYLQDTAAQAANLDPQRFYPGQTSVGALPSELSAFAQRGAYNQGMYGPGGLFGNVLGAAQGGLQGGSYGMGGALSPFATNQLLSQFRQGPESVGQYGFGTDLNFQGPQFGRAGSLDARGALQSMLSGTPDYAGAQGAIDAANAPILRQLNEQVIPGLNQRATFLGNSTGGIKALNQVLPEVGQRMSENALGILEGERQRALNAQQFASGLVSQGGLQANQLGLNRSMGEADLARQLAGLNLSTDQINAGLGGQFRQDVLGLGGLAGGLAGQDAATQARIMSMFPALAQAGMQPSQDAMNFGAYQRMLAENQLGGDIARWNFGQQEPYNRTSFLSNILAQLGGTAGQAQPSGSGALGALGGALTGGQLGSSIAQAFGFGSYNPVYGGGGAPMVTQPTLGAPSISGNTSWLYGLPGYTGG